MLGLVLTKTHNKLGQRIEQCCTADSNVFCPTFNSRTEFRGDSFDATATLYLQINTYDRYYQELRVRSSASQLSWFVCVRLL